jgi:Acetyltransferase (GNAT) family
LASGPLWGLARRVPNTDGGGHKMTIREIRRNECAPVTDLYLEMCKVLAEADSDWGVPDRDPIHRWILRTTESHDAICLVSEVDGVIIGFLLASVARHPVMPGVLGMLEEVHVRSTREAENRKRELVEEGIVWARSRGANPIQTTVGVDSPWADEELSFWKSIGFEHDQAIVRRYFPEEGC